MKEKRRVNRKELGITRKKIEEPDIFERSFGINGLVPEHIPQKLVKTDEQETSESKS